MPADPPFPRSHHRGSDGLNPTPQSRRAMQTSEAPFKLRALTSALGDRPNRRTFNRRPWRRSAGTGRPPRKRGSDGFGRQYPQLASVEVRHTHVTDRPGSTIGAVGLCAAFRRSARKPTRAPSHTARFIRRRLRLFRRAEIAVLMAPSLPARSDRRDAAARATSNWPGPGEGENSSTPRSETSCQRPATAQNVLNAPAFPLPRTCRRHDQTMRTKRRRSHSKRPYKRKRRSQSRPAFGFKVGFRLTASSGGGGTSWRPRRSPHHPSPPVRGRPHPSDPSR